MNISSGKPLHIILIEDDDIDAEAIKRAFQALDAAIKITRFADGRTALEALRSAWGSRLQNEPHLILLDLNLPRMSGLSLLDELRSDPVLRRGIVFALTGSDHEEDKAAAYDRRVAGYLVKAHLGRDYSALRDLLDVYYQAIEFPVA